MLKSLQPWMRAKVSPHITRAHSRCASAGVIKALLLLSDAGTFDHKKFFKACGLSGKSDADVKSAFAIIDQDKSGYIEEEELK